MKDIKIKKISYLETFPVRSAVLRQGKPIETCYFDGDELEDTTHFGLFLEGNLVGITSIFKTNNKNFTQKRQFQLRGMAVLNSFQGSGFGGMLLEKAIEFAKENEAELLWFNARENAVNFYKNYNFCIFGKPFDIPEIGIHYVMSMSFVG